MFTSLYFI